MNPGRQLKDLTAALAVTERMVSVARQEGWEELNALQTRRQELITSAFADPIPGSDAAAAAGVIDRIQALNQDLIALSGQGRDRVADALGTIAAGRRARSAYGNASGS